MFHSQVWKISQVWGPWSILLHPKCDDSCYAYKVKLFYGTHESMVVRIEFFLGYVVNKMTQTLVQSSFCCSLTHWGRDKMAAISQTTLSNAFFLNENVRISIKISLKFVPKGPINNNPALVQIMARCRCRIKYSPPWNFHPWVNISLWNIHPPYEIITPWIFMHEKEYVHRHMFWTYMYIYIMMHGYLCTEKIMIVFSVKVFYSMIIRCSPNVCHISSQL